LVVITTSAQGDHLSGNLEMSGNLTASGKCQGTNKSSQGKVA